MTNTLLDSLTLYGDQASGNCHKVMWTADYLGIPYEWVSIDVVAGEAKGADFQKVSPLGKVPFLKLGDGRGLPESNAIILFLAEAAPDHNGQIPDDPFTRAQLNSWLSLEHNTHEPSIAGLLFQKHFLKKADDEIPADLMERGIAALSIMEMQLSYTDYLVGDGLTLADIALLAYTRLAPEGGFDLAPYAGVRAWVERIEGELRV